MSSILIEMSGINKEFPGVKAVQDGMFTLEEGEIHSLVGENGAGKSTLMKILYGMYSPESGTITVRGESFPSLTPKRAIGMGIGMVHQEFMLVREMTVLENIILGFEPRRGAMIDRRAALDKIDYYARTYGLSVHPDKKVGEISVGEAQRVEIIKTMYRGAEILVLDEPTAVLTPQESEQLFEILRSMKKDGKSIVFISHKLREVLEISDRVTVMRGGRHIATLDGSSATAPELARLMVGREVFLGGTPVPSEPGEVALSVEGVYVPGEKELSKLRGVSFSVRRGEILGIAGVNGNGQSELAEAIAGLRPVQRGRVVLGGVEVQNMPPRKIREHGLSHIPEDRNLRGLDRQSDVKENLAACSFSEPPLSRGGVVNWGRVREFADDLIRSYDIRPAGVDVPAAGLSGGNAQKVVVAREVSGRAPVLLASQPTRGVDIGSIETIRAELNRAKKEGAAVVLISSDLEEILSLSDRIAVMFEGRITGEVSSSEADELSLGLLMTGGRR
ncbi:MAG: Ribose import ATP-binding protein RbsA [Synergistetes bacterium ADurb.BinA166]|nr:MAG: Ribose import ATP-binding protein RbsA [Synergistetes bacterium ADurb.BinA166]